MSSKHGWQRLVRFPLEKLLSAITSGFLMLVAFTPSAHAAVFDIRCLNGWPILRVDSYWIDDQMETYVLPYLYYEDTYTSYNRRFMKVTDIWTENGGLKATFDWDVWARQEFTGWYGAEGSGSYTVDVKIVNSTVYINNGDIDMDNDYLGWVAEWLGITGYFERQVTAFLRDNFGGQATWRLLSSYMVDALVPFGIAAQDVRSVVNWLGSNFLWMDIGHDYTYIGVNWRKYFDQYNDSLSKSMWNAIDRMCPVNYRIQRGEAVPTGEGALESVEVMPAGVSR
jgi:hypothetical protein